MKQIAALIKQSKIFFNIRQEFPRNNPILLRKKFKFFYLEANKENTNKYCNIIIGL